ncbi:sigma-54-dependent transcriptional regulator [Thermosediminibacter oceani]|uniref:PTS system transcriptional activator n=1 Tax=Thermosediminibacter oceani (strain ATCC BAA-1034 / DSM 16646 / JW/IW-1228P) TaxID=555079 RepID=D9RZ81_THEOJ|nr:sigma-54-dependent transcriptional regulator [Thermosediminibacter oceani]ADL08635.1 PTS system transcriptional activator [Thermosediminibacter oceani DSM 16646]
MLSLKRKDRIYQKLRDLTASLSLSVDNSRLGFEASYIGNLIGIDRSNASRELNSLVKEGKVLKIKGKPVLYLDRIYLQEKWGINFANTVIESQKKFILMLKEKGVLKGIKREIENNVTTNYVENSLDNLIGAQDSLKDQITRAKAAILYPPDGLHTLIVGPTGVGKTTFAEAMYKYAIQIGVLPEKSPFIIFNCADYAENPQLLLSQLFGYVKGAFTGADKEKRGLVDEANGGILFLDEVHRLPPEGQEMLFTLMDKGIYRRMGESENTRKAKVRIIAATTEEPQSVLLHTFLRRVPVVIQLPSLEMRTLKERLMFIYQFFWEESRRINVPIKVSKEVIKALLLYDCPGNIGQLKNDIRLICAGAFLEYMMSPNGVVEVKLSILSRHIQEGLFRIRDAKKNEEIIREVNNYKDVVFEGDNTELMNEFNKKFLGSAGNYEAKDDFYEIIVNNWRKYNEEGLSSEEIRRKIENQIKEYFNKYLLSGESEPNTINRDVVLKFVSPDILEAVEYALNNVKDKFKGLIDQRIIYTITLHIATLLERLKKGIVISHPDRENIAKDYQFEYIAAEEIKAKLEEKLYVKIPEDETAFLAMFLHALRIGRKDENIGVLVIMHGDHAASTMANVANVLLGVDHAKALDMPLDEKVEVTLNKAIDIVKQIDKGKGVLILVDMGSLTTFSEIISERTGIMTKTIDMVSTPIVIEATRKALMPDMTLDELTKEIMSLSFAFNNNKEKNEVIEYTQIEFENDMPFLKKSLINILDKTLTFLNPSKAYKILESVLKCILSDIGADIDEEILIKFLFHCSCMIERIIRGESLPYRNLDHIKNDQSVKFELIKKHFEIVEEVFGISIPDTEIAYIVEMISTYYGTLSIRVDTYI